MFNEIADKIKHAPTVEEKKKWGECAYAVIEYGGAYEDSYCKSWVFLSFDEAEAKLNEQLDYVKDKIANGKYDDWEDTQGISLHKIEYYCGNSMELKSYEYDDETGKFEEE